MEIETGPQDRHEARGRAEGHRRPPRHRDLHPHHDDVALVAHIAPDDLSIGCVGFMGGASTLGLGLALGCPDRRVIVFDGDGSLCMQLGSLPTIAGSGARNLTHLLFRNNVYHTSGAQGTPGGEGMDWVMMAKGAGYKDAFAVRSLAELEEYLPAHLDRRGPDLRRATHRPRREDADDRSRRRAVSPTGGDDAEPAPGVSREPNGSSKAVSEPPANKVRGTVFSVADTVENPFAHIARARAGLPPLGG